MLFLAKNNFDLYFKDQLLKGIVPYLLLYSPSFIWISPLKSLSHFYFLYSNNNIIDINWYQ